MWSRKLNGMTSVQSACVKPLDALPIGSCMMSRSPSSSASLLSAHSHTPLALDMDAVVRYAQTAMKITWTVALSAAVVWAFAHTAYLP